MIPLDVPQLCLWPAWLGREGAEAARDTPCCAVLCQGGASCAPLLVRGAGGERRSQEAWAAPSPAHHRASPSVQGWPQGLVPILVGWGAPSTLSAQAWGCPVPRGAAGLAPLLAPPGPPAPLRWLFFRRCNEKASHNNAGLI